MERSDYWRVFAKHWDINNRGWWPKDLAAKAGIFTETLPVHYGGRLLPLEAYLEVPTFLRQGRRLVV